MAVKIDLEGKVAIATGAGRGIGRAIALSLAEAGAGIFVTARTQSQIEETADKVRRLGCPALSVQADATDAGSVARVVERTIAELDGLHILVNNAGVELPKSLLDTTEEEYEAVMASNLKSLFLYTKAAGPHLIEQKYGRVVNMASVGAFVAAPNQTIYHASKAAVRTSHQSHCHRMGKA